MSVEAPFEPVVAVEDDLLNQLRDEIRTESDGWVSTDGESALMLPVDPGDRSLSPAVRSAIASMVDVPDPDLPSEVLNRGLSSVERGLESRQLWTGTLQGWLAALRVERSISPEEVAAAVDVSAAELTALESAGKGIVSLGADAIVRWIRVVGAPAATAIRALELSLDVSVATQAYGARSDGTLRSHADRLLDEVRAQLGDGSATPDDDTPLWLTFEGELDSGVDPGLSDESEVTLRTEA